MQLIYDHLIPGEPVWDLCCDHGYLGLNAYESGLFPEVYFVDQVESIIRRLEQRFHQDHFRPESSSQAYFLSQRGEDISMETRGTLVVAGVGAHTICKIVEAVYGRGLLRAQKLIFLPQKDEKKLVNFLAEKQNFGYHRCNEHYSIVERGRTRKLLIFTSF